MMSRRVAVAMVLSLVPGVLLLCSGDATSDVAWGLRQQGRALASSSDGVSASITPWPAEVCPQEAADCYADTVCTECVIGSKPIEDEECSKLYPVLQDENVTECQSLAASICCRFDVVGMYDCRTDSLTLEYWSCGMEDRGCSFDSLPCNYGNSSSASLSTPSPTVPAAPDGAGSVSPSDAPEVTPTPQPGAGEEDVDGVPTPSPIQLGVSADMNGAVERANPSSGLIAYAGVLALCVYLGRLVVAE